MDETRRAQLAAAGVDVEEALMRFMGNEDLMLKFLLRFPEDPSFSQLKAAMEHGDAAGAFTAAHTLKGVAGNLSLKDLFQQVGAMVEDLRKGDLASAAGKMGDLEAQYLHITQALDYQA